MNGHYGVAAFLIGNTLSAIPYMLLMSVIPTLIVYYLSGLHKGFLHFLYLVSVVFATILSIESLMLVVGSIFPNFVMGMVLVGGFQGIMILIGGFYRLPHDLPKIVWRYPLYYVSFHKYAFQGSFKNEFDGLTFVLDDEEDGRSKSRIVSGREILRNIWQVEMGQSKWVDLIILFGMILLFRLMFLVITKSKEKVHGQMAG